MKKLIFTFAFGCLISSLTQAQTSFQYLYSGLNADEIYDVTQTADGGFAMVGMTYSWGEGGMDNLIIKTDPNGQIVWSYTFGDEYHNIATKIHLAPDNNLIVHNSMGNGNLNDFSDVLKLDWQTGALIWQKTYPNNYSYWNNYTMSEPDASGNFYVNTIIDDPNSYVGLVPLVMKMDANGQMLWTKNYHSNLIVNLIPSAPLMLKNGDLITAYNDGRQRMNEDIVNTPNITRFDSNGNLIWHVGIDTLSFDNLETTATSQITTICEDLSGDIIAPLVIYKNSAAYLYMIKLDANGNMLLTRSFKNFDPMDLQIEVTKSGDYLLYGSTRDHGPNTPNAFNAFLLKMDKQFNPIWYRIYGGIDTDKGLGLKVLQDDRIAISGSTISFGISNYDGFLVVADSLGTGSCLMIPGTFPNPDPANLVLFNPTPLYSDSTLTTGSRTFVSNATTPLIGLACTFLENNELSGYEAIQLHPNPANSQLYLSLPDEFKGSSLNIFTLLGQHMYQVNQVSHSEQIDIENWPQGVYLVQITNGAGKLFTTRLIKE